MLIYIRACQDKISGLDNINKARSCFIDEEMISLFNRFALTKIISLFFIILFKHGIGEVRVEGEKEFVRHNKIKFG